MPIEIHEVEITSDPAPGRPSAPTAATAAAPPASAAQSTQRQIRAARLLDRELSSRASRLRAD